MSTKPMLMFVRLLPVILLVLAAAAWFNDVQEGGRYVIRNLVPPLTVVALAALTLARGGGRWTGAGWRLPLGTIGFAIPAIGLATYLHYAYSINLDGLFDGGSGQLFRYLPYYTFFAGLIGFAIGWIVGRNV
jgi:hypothetical protein